MKNEAEHPCGLEQKALEMEKERLQAIVIVISEQRERETQFAYGQGPKVTPIASPVAHCQDRQLIYLIFFLHSLSKRLERD